MIFARSQLPLPILVVQFSVYLTPSLSLSLLFHSFLLVFMHTLCVWAQKSDSRPIQLVLFSHTHRSLLCSKPLPPPNLTFRLKHTHTSSFSFLSFHYIAHSKTSIPISGKEDEEEGNETTKARKRVSHTTAYTLQSEQTHEMRERFERDEQFYIHFIREYGLDSKTEQVKEREREKEDRKRRKRSMFNIHIQYDHTTNSAEVGDLSTKKVSFSLSLAHQKPNQQLNNNNYITEQQHH